MMTFWLLAIDGLDGGGGIQPQSHRALLPSWHSIQFDYLPRLRALLKSRPATPASARCPAYSRPGIRQSAKA